jgi:hypothetical protein
VDAEVNQLIDEALSATRSVTLDPSRKTTDDEKIRVLRCRAGETG